jgi:hypothetical protein
MGQLETYIYIYIYIILEEKMFYVIFAYMLNEIETLDETLNIWEKYGGNQCKLVVISKF